MNDFFQRLSLELIRAGVWGRAAGMLEQELRDHYLTEKEALLAQGKSNDEADKLALAKLGEPTQLAQQARRELNRRDGRFKTQFLLRFAPLFLGALSWVTMAWGVLWLFMFLFSAFHPIHAKTWPPHDVVAFNHLFCAMSLVYFLAPWLVAYLWILRACYFPVHGWRCLLLISGYMTLSYYICTSFILFTDDGIWYQFDREWINGLLLFLCLILLSTPWRVRALKLSKAQIRRPEQPAIKQ